jgi:hypothetical protein
MLNRKDAVSMAVVALLASAGFAFGETPTPVAPSLTLDRQALKLDDAAPTPLLQQGLTAIGVQPYLDKAGITATGYIETGYEYNLRNKSGTPKIFAIGGGGSSAGPLAFNSEPHNNYDVDQVDLQIARAVDPKKFDVGGLVEVMYGEDADSIHSDGLTYNQTDEDQFDIPQAYIDVSIPVGNGLKVRAGKFDTLIGYEVINPNGNPFYSHSDLFAVEPLTHTGVVAFYTVNDSITVAGGIARGWDQASQDNNGSPDGLFQVTYAVNKQLNVSLQGTIGPEDTIDEAHYRIAPDLVVTYAATDSLSFAFEGLYFFDGGYNNLAGNTNNTLPVDAASSAAGNPAIGTYGDVWGGAFYTSYKLNDYFTFNLRAEGVHDYRASTSGSASNWYEATVGVTITPLPKDKYLSGVKFRPEVRYDYADHDSAPGVHAFPVGTSGQTFRDQWTAAFDVIVNF